MPWGRLALPLMHMPSFLKAIGMNRTHQPSCLWASCICMPSCPVGHGDDPPSRASSQRRWFCLHGAVGYDCTAPHLLWQQGCTPAEGSASRTRGEAGLADAHVATPSWVLNGRCWAALLNPPPSRGPCLEPRWLPCRRRGRCWRAPRSLPLPTTPLSTPPPRPRREFVVNIISEWMVNAANHTCGAWVRA